MMALSMRISAPLGGIVLEALLMTIRRVKQKNFASPKNTNFRKPNDNPSSLLIKKRST